MLDSISSGFSCRGGGTSHMSSCLALVPSEPPRSELPPTNQQELCTKMMSMLFSMFDGRQEGNGNRANSGNWNKDLGCSLNVFDTPRQTRENVPPTDTPLTDKPTTGGSGGFGHEKSNVSASEEQVEACLGDLDKSPTRVRKGRISKKPAAAKPPPKAAKPAAKAPSKAAKPSGKASSKAKASPKARISVSCCLERTRNNWQARTSVGDCRQHSSFSFGAGKAYATSSKAEAACKRHLDEFCKRNKVQCLGKRKSMVL